MKSKILIILLLFTFCISCKQDNTEENPKRLFNQKLWSTKDAEGNYGYRDEMLEDLVYNVKLKGLKKEEIIKMLGEPERTNNDYLYYEVLSQEVGNFPMHKKFLVIKLDKNNTVEWRKIKD